MEKGRDVEVAGSTPAAAILMLMLFFVRVTTEKLTSRRSPAAPHKEARSWTEKIEGKPSRLAGAGSVRTLRDTAPAGFFESEET
jgi:hypothetical protein